MVSATLSGALDGAACAEAVAFIVSYEGLAERGLGSLPGGDESELVKGVRAWREAGGPARDMAEGAEKVEEVVVGVELPESTWFSSESERRASSKSEYKLPLVLPLRVSPAALGA